MVTKLFKNCYVMLYVVLKAFISKLTFDTQGGFYHSGSHIHLPASKLLFSCFDLRPCSAAVFITNR